MKRIASIEKTFDVIRSMEPEIEFAGIRQFVLEQSIVSHSTLFHRIKIKTILPMFAVTSAVAATLLFTQPHPATISAGKHENAQRVSSPQNAGIKIPFKEISSAPLFNESAGTIQQETAVVNPQPSNREANAEINMAMISPPSLMPADSPARKKTISTSVNGRSVTVISSTPSSTVTTNVNSGSVSASSSANGDSTEVYVNNSGPEKTIIHAKTQAGTKCNCNFGGDQTWVDDIVRELLNENLISNPCNYNFRFSAQSLSVDGKEITDKAVISKIKDYYESSTNNHMVNDDDYVSVKVTGSKCDFVKSISDK